MSTNTAQLRLRIAAIIAAPVICLAPAGAANATGGGGGGGDHKVTLCHNGHPITVDKHAAKKHLKHGDSRQVFAKDLVRA